jgi:CRP-like cAMP-binding protein
MLTVPCRACPLRRQPLFVPFTEEEVAFMESFKMGELAVDPGTTILMEGSNSPQLYTVLRGRACATRPCRTGGGRSSTSSFPATSRGCRRAHGRDEAFGRARTRMMLCVFDRSQLWEVFRNSPQRAYDLTWIAAVEEHFLGETIASLGQRDAGSGSPGLSADLAAAARGGGRGNGTVPLPFRQQDLADALGLQPRAHQQDAGALRERGLCDWSDGVLRVLDTSALASLAVTELEPPPRRPLM